MRTSDSSPRLLNRTAFAGLAGVAGWSSHASPFSITRIELDSDVLKCCQEISGRSKVLRFTIAIRANARELTFALLCQPADTTSWKNSRRRCEHLRQQPWCTRVPGRLAHDGKTRGGWSAAICS